MYLPLSSSEKDLFTIVAHQASLMNQEVYAIGGFIRDRLLDIPSKDIDFVTTGDGPGLAEKVCTALGKGTSGLSVYKNFAGGRRIQPCSRRSSRSIRSTATSRRTSART